MTVATEAPAKPAAPARVSGIRVEPLTCTIGAELSNVDLGSASRDPAMVAEIRALLLKHRVLFFRDQDFTRAEHVAFARHFGSLEDHPVVGSDPDHPGLVRIYKGADTRHLQYEKFYAGASFIVRNHNFREAPWDAYHKVVEDLMASYDVPEASGVRKVA